MVKPPNVFYTARRSLPSQRLSYRAKRKGVGKNAPVRGERCPTDGALRHTDTRWRTAFLLPGAEITMVSAVVRDSP